MADRRLLVGGTARRRPEADARESVLEQHRALRRLLAAVEAVLLSPSGPGFAAALDARLAELEVALEDHFLEEEAAGLFEKLVAAAPESAPQALALRAQHRRILSRLARLRLQARRGPAPPASAAVRRILRDLEGHEAAENDLITRVLDGATAAQD